MMTFDLAPENLRPFFAGGFQPGLIEITLTSWQSASPLSWDSYMTFLFGGKDRYTLIYDTQAPEFMDALTTAPSGSVLAFPANMDPHRLKAIALQRELLLVGISTVLDGVEITGGEPWHAAAETRISIDDVFGFRVPKNRNGTNTVGWVPWEPVRSAPFPA